MKKLPLNMFDMFEFLQLSNWMSLKIGQHLITISKMYLGEGLFVVRGVGRKNYFFYNQYFYGELFGHMYGTG